MTAAKIVMAWYERHRSNEDYPFTIPNKSLVALTTMIRTELERLQAQIDERDAEQLAPPTDEEES